MKNWGNGHYWEPKMEKKEEGQGGKQRFTDDDIRYILSRHDKAKSDRATWESTWQNLADYIIPERANILAGGTPGAS